MASLTKRTDGHGRIRWVARVRKLGYSRARTFRTKAAAEDWARDLEDGIAKGKGAVPTNRTVRDLVEKFLTEELHRYAESEKRNVASRLGWWGRTLGPITLMHLRPSHIRDALRSLKVADKTRNRYHAALSRALTIASREWDWISMNPAMNVSRRSEGHGRRRVLSDAERARLLHACSSNQRLHSMVVFALTTGCRLGEIEKLERNEMNLANRTVFIAESKNGESRKLPLTSAGIKAIRSLPLRTDGLVFGSFPRKTWELALKASSVDDFRMHDCRHCFATELSEMGASVTDLKYLLGHRTLSMVARYEHSKARRATEFTERLDRTFGL